MTAVSVVIPNLNSPVIGRVLEAVRGQTADLSQVEVLVVGRDDLGLVASDRLVRFLESAQPLPPAQARNRGLAAARGEILVFLDADCVPETDWLARVLARFSDPEVHVVGGSMALSGTSFWTLADNVATFYEYLSTLPAGERGLLPTCNLACRRCVLEEVGLFDEAYPYPAGEDADLTLRARLAGHRLYFEPAAVVWHYPGRSSFRSLLQHAQRLGRYSVKVDRRYACRLGVPWVMRKPLWLLLTAPLLAGAVTCRAFQRDHHLWRRWPVAPVMFAAKLAWCIGAAATLRGGAQVRAPWGTIPQLTPVTHD